MAAGIDNHQQSLALTQLLVTQGPFPARPDGFPGTGEIPLAAMRSFAGNFAPGGTVEAGGQVLSIAQNQALFSLLGTSFGGDGRTNFALPDLGDLTM
ncbi:phage tail protein, partial [Rhizobiaceae sp. 2RAB30]